jgi:hypothetical protein
MKVAPRDTKFTTEFAVNIRPLDTRFGMMALRAALKNRASRNMKNTTPKTG